MALMRTNDRIREQHATYGSSEGMAGIGIAVALEIDSSVATELQRLLGSPGHEEEEGLSLMGTRHTVGALPNLAPRLALVLTMMSLRLSDPVVRQHPRQPLIPGLGSSPLATTTNGAMEQRQVQSLAPWYVRAAASALKRSTAASLATQTRHLLAAAEEAGAIAEATSTKQAALRCCAALVRSCGAQVADVFLYDAEDDRLVSACGRPGDGMNTGGASSSSSLASASIGSIGEAAGGVTGSIIGS